MPTQLIVTVVAAMITLLVGLLLGVLLGALWQRGRTLDQARDAKSGLEAENQQLKLQLVELQKDRESDADKLKWHEQAQLQMRETFSALASQTLQTNGDEFLKRANEQMNTMLTAVRGDWNTQRTEIQGLVAPLKDSLTGLDSHVRELEQKREGAYQSLNSELVRLSQANVDLHTSTSTLNQALRSSSVRGRWGEFQLRRIVEMAGLKQHVDFDVQTAIGDGRPDMLIRLPNGGILPVDSKAPMQAYLDAVSITDEAQRNERLKDHAKAMRERIKELSAKAYWNQLPATAEFVVMFVPNEACFSAAFEVDGDLLDFAVGTRVLPAAPVSLLGLLRAVAYGWQQHAANDNAMQVAELGREFHSRMGVFLGHLAKTGKELDSAVTAYNQSVASLEGRLMPTARKFRDLGIVSDDLVTIAQTSNAVRLPAVEA